MTPTNPNREGTTPDDGGNGMTKQKLKDDAREAKREVEEKVRGKAAAGQQRLAEGANALSDAIDAAAANLDDQDRQGLARYAREVSSNLAAAAGQLEGRSVDDLAKDAKRLARNNPALFMLGSIALGFGLSRFFKASAQREFGQDDSSPNDEDLPGAYRKDDTFRDDEVSTGITMRQGQEDEERISETYTTRGSFDESRAQKHAD